MPRILPRLVKALEESSLRPQTTHAKRSFSKPRPSKSLWRADVPQFSWSRQRAESILLDEINPVMHRDAYTKHKTLPPQVQLQPLPKGRRERTQEDDRPRAMTQEERGWWASPYLRMLASPLRTCLATNQQVPMDFMIRLAPMQLPVPRGARKAQTLLPDGIEHPRFRQRRLGGGSYIICNRSALEHMVARGSYKRLAPNLSAHPRLADQIGHLLRVRVLQELELLAARLINSFRGAHEHPVLRRLSRAEWLDIKKTGVIPYEGAIALLVVPPLNRDPVTKQRPEPSSSAEPPAPEQQVKIRGKSRRRPVSEMYAAQKTGEQDNFELQDEEYELMPQPMVPVYHGPALFTVRSQRAALLDALKKVMATETRARLREGLPKQKQSPKQQDAHLTTDRMDKGGKAAEGKNSKSQWAKGDQKASHAYLLCSDSETVLRADMVPLLVALWRVRMWEGQGWDMPWKERWKLKPRPLPA